jgi:hypothetical protein
MEMLSSFTVHRHRSRAIMESMKWRTLRALAVLLAVAVLPLVKAACGSASAPAPLAEVPVPAVLKFVDSSDLAIDLAAISPPTTKAVSVRNFIEYGPLYFNNFIDQFFSPALTGIKQLGIPTCVDETKTPPCTYRTTFAIDNFTFSATSGPLAGGAHSVKIDFANFDYNNSGSATDEGCSGNAAKAPICVRFWLDGKSFIAGVFDVPPTYASDATTLTKLGSGRFKMHVADYQGFESYFAYKYGVPTTSAASKEIEYFFETKKIPDSPNAVPRGTYDFFEFGTWDGHSKLSQVGPDATAFKSLNFWSQLLGEDFGTEGLLLKYIGQYIEGGGYWSGSFVFEGNTLGGTGVSPAAMPNICATLLDGFTVLPPTPCSDLGILVGTTPFVSAFQPSDVAWPTDFPASPTF